MFRDRFPADAAGAFPRGLLQPEGSFRFSADALLLAAFARSRGAERAADLGTGCGVVALGLALRFPRLACLGIERDAALVEAARHNARALGCAERVHFVQGDLADTRALAPGSCDTVTANPPYRLAGAGRPSPCRGRQSALADVPGALAVFARAAALLLRRHGRFACVFSPARLGELFAELRAADLAPRRLRAVHPRPGRPAVLVLIEARKGARPDLAVEAPLVLHAGGSGREYSAGALDFCPWLA